MNKMEKNNFKWDIMKFMTLFAALLITFNILFKPFINSTESVRIVGEIGGNMFLVWFNLKIGGWLN